MKRIYWLILMPVLAGAAYLLTRHLHPAKGVGEEMHAHSGTEVEEMVMPAAGRDGLLWLKSEFRLTDADYDRISNLHEAYLPGCMERCREIARVRRELFALIQNSKNLTPELKAKFEESAHLRAECSGMMLAHFYEVAAAMPPAPAQRYLEWVTRETLMD